MHTYTRAYYGSYLNECNTYLNDCYLSMYRKEKCFTSLTAPNSVNACSINFSKPSSNEIKVFWEVS